MTDFRAPSATQTSMTQTQMRKLAIRQWSGRIRLTVSFSDFGHFLWNLWAVAFHNRNIKMSYLSVHQHVRGVISLSVAVWMKAVVFRHGPKMLPNSYSSGSLNLKENNRSFKPVAAQVHLMSKWTKNKMIVWFDWQLCCLIRICLTNLVFEYTSALQSS